HASTTSEASGFAAGGASLTSLMLASILASVRTGPFVGWQPCTQNTIVNPALIMVLRFMSSPQNKARFHERYFLSSIFASFFSTILIASGPVNLICGLLL